VSGEIARIPSRDLRSAQAFNAFYFAPALTRGVSISTLFATHPPLQKRLEQLAKLEAAMGRGLA
jgi:heat shock protein HtpX